MKGKKMEIFFSQCGTIQAQAKAGGGVVAENAVAKGNDPISGETGDKHRGISGKIDAAPAISNLAPPNEVRNCQGNDSGGAVTDEALDSRCGAVEFVAESGEKMKISFKVAEVPESYDIGNAATIEDTWCRCPKTPESVPHVAGNDNSSDKTEDKHNEISGKIDAVQGVANPALPN
jgi:hypothetical protein